MDRTVASLGHPDSAGVTGATLLLMEFGQRKTVSVVFSDLVASTSMAEQVDPEALAELLTRYFDSMQSIIERHGGSVEKFIGDAVVGMFGVPTTHEDDALRAVRAALEMTQALEAMNPELEQRHGVRLAARTGVNTGEVALTGEGRGPGGQRALGHAINMAARLEQAAAAGEVLIGKATHELVADLVAAQPVGPLTVKGSANAIQAWRITGMAEGNHRGWQGGSRFVGRVQELETIESAFETALTERACVLATVVAPPGMGKSRLAAETTRRLAERARILFGQCLPYGEGVTYAPLIEMVSVLVQEHEVHPNSDAQSTTPGVQDAVGRAQQAFRDSALASPEETAWVFKQLLESLASERPVVVVVDDIHWAEPVLLDLLDYLATLSIGRPILLLCLARPELFDSRPEWAMPRQHAVTLRLEPLTIEESDALLASLTDADQATQRRIVKAAAGVPLFVEQMAALGSEGDAGTVPSTVRALLAARIDRLQKPERTVLERASIQGEGFDRATLASLLGSNADAPLGGTLMGLVRREFVRPERGADGRERFRFSHALLRDAVYEQMPRRLRSELHQRYAELLASTDAANLEVIGHHLERAHAERAALGGTDSAVLELGVRAGRALRDAGNRALARKEWQHARDLLERARGLLAADARSEVLLLPDLLHATGELGDWERAAELQAQATDSARALGDESTELRAEMVWAQLRMRRGDAGIREMVPVIATRAEAHFARTGDYSNLASALLLKMTTPGLSIGAMIGMLREAQVHADRAGDERTQIEIWDELGGSMIFGPTPYPEILEFIRREIGWARERGIAFTEADGLLGEAYAIAAAGDTQRAREAAAVVRALFEQLPGFVSQLGETDVLAASIEADAGELAAAEALYRRAMDALERGGHVPWWTSAGLGLARVLVDLGRTDEAGAVLATVDQRGYLWSARAKCSQLQVRATFAAATGDMASALDLAQRAVEAITGNEAPQSEARARETLGDLLRLAGDAEASGAELRRALELYRAKGYRPGEQRILTQNRRDAGP